MTASATIRHPQYYADFEELGELTAASAPGWLAGLRAAAWERFNETGFPTARRGNERWKYTNVSPIARREFKYYYSPAGETGGSSGEGGGMLLPTRQAGMSGWREQTFIDNRAMGSLWGQDGRTGVTGDGLAVCTIGQALLAGDDALGEHLGRYAAYAEDAFVALNTAFLNDGVYVRLPDDYGAEVQLCITYLNMPVSSPGRPPAALHPRTLLVAGRNTRLTVFETYIGAARENYLTNAVTEVAVGEGASVEHYRLLRQRSPTFHIGATRVRQAAGSRYRSGAFAVGSRLARHDLAVTLAGPGARCELSGLYYTRGGHHMDNLVSIDHAAPGCVSRLNYKGILDGKSRAVFGGEVLVRENAQKSDAQQTDKNLLLSADAEVYSKPSLLIYADDVQCSHGATAGQIDADTLFYLRSRGLDLDQASGMLINAFAREIIDAVQPEPVQTYLGDLFEQTIRNKRLPLGIV